MHRAVVTEADNGLVSYYNKGINKILHDSDTTHSLLKAVVTLINRWSGEDSDKWNIERAYHLRNHRCCTSTSTSTHTCGDKNQVRLMLLDIVADNWQRLLSLILSNLSIVTSTLTVTHTYLLRIAKRALI